MNYRDLTSFNIDYFELINFDYNFILERSDTSDSRPYTTFIIIPELSFDEYNPNILQNDTGQNNIHFNQDDTTELLRNQEPQHFNIIPDPQQDTTTLQNVADPSEIATIQNVSELSDEAVNITQSLTITNHSNILLFPVHNITQNPINDLTQKDTTHNTNQDNTYTLFTSITHVTQEFPTQQTSPQNYDPPPLPSQFSTQTTPQNFL